MNRIGASPGTDDSSPAWRFPLRPVPFAEAGDLLRESIAPFRAAPLRLIGLFLLLWVPLVFLANVQAVGPFLGEVAEVVAFTAYTCALDAAFRSEPPDLRHLGVVLKFGHDKLMLLMLTGLVPILVGIGVLCGVWGVQETVRFLDQLTRPNGHLAAAMDLDFQVAENIAGLPFTFVLPVWALYRWSASRSMAANLLACWVNWRWVLAMAAFTALADNFLIWLKGESDELVLVSLAGVIALQMLSLSWTLALARRTLPER
jgi:hypothetical protein